MVRNASFHVTDPGAVFRALGAALGDFVEDHVQNASINSSSHGDGHHTADHEPKVLLFLFFAFTVGGESSAAFTHMNKSWLAFECLSFCWCCVCMYHVKCSACV